MAARLIEQLSEPAFNPEKFHDEYADRVRKAADEKAAGQQITVAPEQPAAQIIDLFEALKQSLREKPAAKTADQVSEDAPKEALKGPTKAAERAKRGGKRQLG